MISRYILFGFLFFLGLFSSAQYTQIGEGGFESTLYGPISPTTASQSYSRYAYIYPANSFTNLSHNDSLTALAFKHTAITPLSGSTNVRIFLKATSQSQFGSSPLNWLAETRNGMVKVFEGSPNSLFHHNSGFVTFKFNQVNAFQFDTSGGAIHFEILVEYTQQSSQTPIKWYCESSLDIAAFVSNNETKYVRGTGSLDSICNDNTTNKPTLKLYYPRDFQDLEVKNIQSFVEKPVLMEQADSIKVLIQNTGKATVQDSRVFLNVTGSSSHNDTLTIDSLESLELREFVFSKYNADKIGDETIIASLSSDNNSANNSLGLTRKITYNSYSYTSKNQSPQALGFDNQIGVLVGKYYCTPSTKLDFVDVEFKLQDKPFQLVVYKQHPSVELPGELLYQTDTLFSISGTNHIVLTSEVFVSGNFYVGVRQIDDDNFYLDGVSEESLISHSFYYLLPTVDSVWTELSNWSDTRLAIHPAIVGGNDLFVNSVSIPTNNDTFTYSTADSIVIEASVINLGYLQQNDFDVRLDILNRFNQIIFTSIQNVSVVSGDTVLIQFDKFSRANIGLFTARITALSVFDMYEENSVLDTSFYIVKEHDYSANYIFEPSPADTFEVNKTGFWPRVRVFNYGVNKEEDVPVFVQLLKKNHLLYEDTILVSLKSQFSEIVSFDSIIPTEIGDLEFRVFTMLESDLFPGNDTINTFIFGIASDDLEVESFLTPTVQEKFKIDTNFQPKVRVVNNGIYDRLNVKVITKIYTTSDIEVYSDSSSISVGSYSTNSLTFSTYNCNTLGDIKIISYLIFDGDQYAKNDTLVSFFKVVEQYDLKLVQLIEPLPNRHYLINSSNAYPSIELFNNGKKEIDSALIEIQISDDLGPFYYDSITVSLGIDEHKIVDFNTLLTYDKIGSYSVLVINKWEGEQSPSSNDTLLEKYFVRYNLDVAIDSHTTPKNHSIFELTQPVNPKVSIRNAGLITAFDIAVEVEVLKGNVSKFKDTLMLASLDHLQNINLQSPVFWLADSVGTYMLFSRLLGEDDDSTNNVFSSTFTLVKTADLKTNKIEFPLEADVLYTNKKYTPKVWIKNDGLTNFDFLSVVANLYIDDTLYYTNSKALSLNENDSALVSFDRLIFDFPSSNAFIQIYTAAQGDVYNYNDTLTNEFTIVQTISVEQLADLSVKVYPNPYSNYVIIESDFQIEHIRLYSLMGSLIAEYFPSSKKCRIDKGLDLSTFILEIKSNETYSRKTLIRRE